MQKIFILLLMNLSFIPYLSSAQQLELISESFISASYGQSVKMSETVHVLSTFGLESINVSDVQNPVVANQLRIRHARTLLDIEDRLYISTDEGSYWMPSRQDMIILDCSTTDQPTIVSQLSNQGAHSFVRAGSYLYTGRQALYGIGIYDVTNPSQPDSVGFYWDNSHFHQVEVSEGLLYAISRVDSQWYLQIFDLVEPLSPDLVSYTPLFSQTIQDLVVDGNYLYVLESQQLRIFDVSDPGNPVERPEQPLSSTALQMEIAGSTGYLMTSPLGLVVLDLTQPDQPVVLTSYPQFLGYLNRNDSLGFLSQYGLKILQMEDPLAIQQLGHVSKPMIHTNQVMTMGETAFLFQKWKPNAAAPANYYLTAVDVSSPLSPTITDSLRLDEIYIYNPSGQMTGHGNYLFLTTTYDIRIFEWTNTDTIAQIGEIDTGGFKRDGLALHFPYLYTYKRDAGAFDSGQLDIYTVENPGEPEFLNSFQMDSAILDMEIQADKAYLLCHEAGLFILDLAQPTQPVEIGFFVDQEATGLDVEGAQAALARNEFGIQIVDVSNPTDPYPLAGFALPNRYIIQVKFVSDYLAALDQTMGIIALNTTNGTVVSEVQTLSIPQQFNNHENLIFIADYEDLAIVEAATVSIEMKENQTFEGKQNLLLQQNYPNPWFLSPAKGNPSTTIAFNLPAKQAVTLRIYNTAGQLVKTLLDGTHSTPAGTHEVTWDGRNEHGLPVSSGVYFYRLEASAKEHDAVVQTRRMVLLR